jgi:hypothetical protein
VEAAVSPIGAWQMAEITPSMFAGHSMLCPYNGYGKALVSRCFLLS